MQPFRERQWVASHEDYEVACTTYKVAFWFYCVGDGRGRFTGSDAISGQGGHELALAEQQASMRPKELVRRAHEEVTPDGLNIDGRVGRVPGLI